MKQASDIALEHRAEIKARAYAIGLNEEYIDVLVDEFYSRIQRHPVLGEIFNRVIKDNWDHHLVVMKSFWASIAFNAGTYSGKPVVVHNALENIEPWHFTMWLGLFHQTLLDTAPNEEVVTYLMSRAERIASSLQRAMFKDRWQERFIK